jgi:hypothetical protein
LFEHDLFEKPIAAFADYALNDLAKRRMPPYMATRVKLGLAADEHRRLRPPALTVHLWEH